MLVPVSNEKADLAVLFISVVLGIGGGTEKLVMDTGGPTGVQI